MNRFLKVFSLLALICLPFLNFNINIREMLLAAGGANYSVQEDNKGDFSGYKNTTKAFYEEKDKNTQVKAIYETGPLSMTPCDISGRSMVASQTEFKQNLK
jgi:hypothetical protein